ncbi:MAG TPA: AGE family epimerase/isomerase [Bacteroidales bacterium]|nr:AGE family epimerase/isomerase [Bacteroidales bacterium]HPJ60816.1 AGE family epimerase/isomerase [Bacteroidales bacterium]HPR13590.1 AGE family epimerase/isomerase [Bacteroidales bacterium]HRW86552.1 AGE family epimerase/isomerase [Bacteroidales bacterium]
MDLKKLTLQYRQELVDNVIPFWEKKSIDREYGGFLTCLDRKGNVYDTDKFIWLQARQVWTFAMLFNNVSENEKWLEIAERGAHFLLKNGRDQTEKWYFAVTRHGSPILAPYSIFSDCFATLAFSELYKADKQEKHARIASDTFRNILSRAGNPKGIFEKRITSTRNLKNFALPMILSGLALQIEPLLDSEYVNEIIEKCVEDVMNTFYDQDSGLILENVNDDGTFSDTFEGRMINPGHAIEAMWFILDIAEKNGNKQLAENAVARLLRMLDYGWDQEYGGIFYFLDIKGHPPLHLEWDQKLWWVHIETLISLIKGYRFTGNEECLKWFMKVHEYTWSHFPDPVYGEWFGYLNRGGEVLLPLKGGKWKGCFHLPRGLYKISETLKELQK